VKIIDLAANMIRLSGKEPRLPGDPVTSPREVAIKIVGSRPGEKLHEELSGEEEAVGDTDHPKIRRLSRPGIDDEWLQQELAELGTGTTTTITRRIAWQVASGVFAPDQIVAVTFTDKAAKQLQARLGGLGVEGVRASTFHSAALALVRRFTGDPGKILPTKALLLRQIAKRLPAPYK